MRKLKLLLVLCLVAIAASASKTVYFNPGAWDADGAQYAAWAWETGEDGKWYAMTDTNDDGIFEYTFDDAIGNLIFARISSLSDASQFTGAIIVNKTSDINRCEDGLLYVNRGSGNSPQIAICALNPSAGDDMTSFVINPNFSSSADGWAITGQARLYNGTGFDGDKFIELTNWGSSWDATISQSINGLPNGYYVVKAASQMSGASEIWMKLVANGAESRFSRNGDTKGNILANGTETTIGSGVAGWRYTSVIAKVTDGTMTISGVGHSDAAERWGNFDHVTLTYFGDEIANNTDVTDFISNWDFWGCFNGNFNGWSISAPNGGNTWVNGDSNVEYWIGTAANGAFDYYQTVSGLPKGKYSISASMWNSTDNGGGSANGNAGVYGTSNENTVFKGVNVDSRNDALNTYTTDNIIVSNGELRLGVKNNGTMGARWFGVDWIKLQFVEPYISAFAKEIAAATATPLTAGKWYKFTPASTGDHTFEATTLANIIYTTTDQLKSEATGTTAGGTIALTKGTTYYIMSSSAQTLTISPQSFVYTVGEAAADVSYIQKGNTVTVTYASISTDNPDPTFVKDFSGVTFGGNSIDVTPIANGFTFEVPTVTAETDYTLAIPAAAIGYSDDGGTYNAAQNITLKTPAIFDGVYYMYNTYTESYISRAGDYNTQAVLDNWGLAFNVSTDAENNTKLQYFDSQYWLGDDTWCYGDCTGGRVRTFNVTQVVGGYKFLNTNNSKYLAANSGAVVADAVEGGNLVGTSNIWALESTEAHKANYTANANTQAAAAAANVSLLNELGTITTKAALEAELASHYTATPIAITGAKAEKYQVYPGNGKDAGPVTYYSETVSDLEPGLYKLSVDAFQRAASNDNVFDADGARGVIYLYAGDAKTQLKSVSEYGAPSAYAGTDYAKDGRYYPNREASAYDALATGNYTNEVYVYVEDAGEGTGSLEIGIKNPSRLGGNFATWCVYNNWTLTRYEKTPFTASFVNGAGWETVKAYVWNGTSDYVTENAWPGDVITKTGEINDNENTYDVYTYSVVRNGLPEKIIFNDGTGGSVDITQTDNLIFVDGMLNTDFVTFSPVYAVVGSNLAETDKAIFSSKWDQETTTDILTEESAGVYSKTYTNQTLDKQTIVFKVIKKDYKEAKTATDWYTTVPVNAKGNMELSIPVKGIYNITFTFTEEGSVVASTATKVKEAVTISDKRWATTVTNSPLDFSRVTEFDAYTATVSDSKVVLTKVDDVQAETGLVLKLKDGEDPATFYVPLAVSSSTDKGSLKFSSTLTYNTWHDNGGENNKFYGLYVNGEGDAQFTLINCSAENEVTIPAQKAFLLLNNGIAQARLEVVFDDETTGISTLNTEDGAERVYNLNGQRVNAPSKGLYIVNGKKVVKK